MIKLGTLKTRDYFGETLVAQDIISREELVAALNLQKQSPDKLGKLLVDIGALSQLDMVRHLSTHLGVPWVSGDGFPQVPVVEDTFSPRFMKETRCLPIEVKDDGILVIAMADPLDSSVLDSVRLFTDFQ